MIALNVNAQVNWMESFVDLQRWNGDTAVFSVDSGLNLNDTIANQVVIWRYSSAADSATWRFSVAYDFMPSSSNHASFVLMSSTPDFWGDMDGYFVRVGGGSQRTISLIRRSGSSNSILFETTAQFLAKPNASVDVEIFRSSTGQWNMRVDTTSAGQWLNVGTLHDNTHTSSFFSGFACRYTVTRADKMSFGSIEVSGPSYSDAQPPIWENTKVFARDSVQLVFDRAVDAAAVNVYVDGTPCTVYHSKYLPEKISVSFPYKIPINQNVDLSVSGIESVIGVLMPNEVRQIIYRKAGSQDVVINELMVNPSPGLGYLPEHSYIELYNTSSLPVPLDDWQLQINQSHRRLPSYTLEPGAYVVLVREETLDDFPNHIPLLGISMAQNALTNSEGEVVLYTDNNVQIDGLRYQDSWYNHHSAVNGGWSLERKDAYASCSGEINWCASSSFQGGTPGQENASALRLDTLLNTSVSFLALPSDTVVGVHYDGSIVDDSSYWELDGVALDPVQISDRCIQMLLPFPIKAGNAHQLSNSGGVFDCVGGQLPDTTLTLVLPREPRTGDLIINELLPAPFERGVSFLELLNVCPDYLEINGLSVSQEFGVSSRRVMHQSRILSPGELLVVTPSVSKTVAMYPTHNSAVFAEHALPSMPNESGTIEVLSATGDRLDAVTYTSFMHSPFIRDSRGVSLERINPHRPSDEEANWTSASEKVGWGTPGAENSNTVKSELLGEFSLSPDVLRPNANGYDDVLHVHYNLKESGAIGTLSIFTASGQEVSAPYRYTLLQTNGVLSWDGRTNRSYIVAPGLYVAVLEVSTPSGKRLVFKDAFAVVH